MIRHRGGPPPEEESSSDEEDAFSALSSGNKAKAPAKQKSVSANNAAETVENNSTTKTPSSLPLSNTSSMKRHHGSTDSRKAKMDALLQELEVDNATSKRSGHRRAFVPEKKGSFVQPGEEHLTTNIFVGNLAPSITEEMMIDLFRQFGDLYSLKIMWPRTLEERARNRNTGFVCFMNREDAEDAMEACDETDPFNVGRRIMMRWGKNVKRIGTVPFAAKAGGSMTTGPEAKRRRTDDGPFIQAAAQNVRSYYPSVHGVDAIRVVVPQDPKRARFITTIASFVAKDGSLLEQRLAAKEIGNPKFDFLALNEVNSVRQREEHVFYKWRVYAFCQGDGFEMWRTGPFQMFKDNGKFWIPPPINRAAAMREEQATMEREQSIRQQKVQRRRMMGRKDYMTGRQLEQAKFGRASVGAADGGATMADNEIKDFHSLTRVKLCASRDSICNAMAYCFEKSGAAKQISELLKELLTDAGPGVSVETRIARLYLLSDILYNSQQPGVRNAFLYRDAIERMAPEVFASLGSGKGNVGRMTFMKLKTAVSSILSAWTNWSVYNPAFIDELEARFEGRELPSAKVNVASAEQEEAKEEETSTAVASETEEPAGKADAVTIVNAPRGDWKEVTDEPPATPKAEGRDASEQSKSPLVTEPKAQDAASEGESDVDGEPLEDDDLDGESLGDEDLVEYEPEEGEIDEEGEQTKDDGELDGEPLEDDDS